MPINKEGKDWIKKAFDFEDATAANMMKGLSSVEKAMYKTIVGELVKFDEAGGGIKLTAANQAKLTTLKARLIRMIKKSRYGTNATAYLRSFSDMEKIAAGQTKAISGLTANLKWFESLRTTATQNIEGLLVNEGLAAKVVDPIMNTFRNMVVTGANKEDITAALMDAVLGNEDKEGLLTRHASQIATDGINQYHGAVDEIIGKKFGLNWGVYIGSIIKTSREQCRHWVEKEYIHRDELAVEIKLADKKGSGMIPGTTPSNFAINRGGYNCRHSFTWVSDEVVPEDVRETHES